MKEGPWEDDDGADSDEVGAAAARDETITVVIEPERSVLVARLVIMEALSELDRFVPVAFVVPAL